MNNSDESLKCVYVIVLADTKMADMVSDSGAAGDPREIPELPSGDSFPEDGKVPCDSATVLHEPMPADPGGAMCENTAMQGTETTTAGPLEQHVDTRTKDPPMQEDVTNNTLAECIDSVSLEADPGSEIPLKEQSDSVGAGHVTPLIQSSY